MNKTARREGWVHLRKDAVGLLDVPRFTNEDARRANSAISMAADLANRTIAHADGCDGSNNGGAPCVACQSRDEILSGLVELPPECPRCGKPFARSSDARRLLRGGVCMCDQYTPAYHCPICGAPGLVRGLGWSTCAACGPIDHDKLPVREESDANPRPAITAGQDKPPTQSAAHNPKLTGK